MNQTITIIVAPDGKTKVETNGFAGQSCRDASKFISPDNSRVLFLLFFVVGRSFS